MPLRSRVALAALVLCSSRPLVAQDRQPDAEYVPVAQLLERVIAHEIADKQLPALSIALVDDQRTVWARGFGFANPKDSTRAKASTVYRVGSVSKLFTDLAIMQLVEQKKIDLDAPIGRYLPDFHPHNPFGKPIPLRELMSLRAGLVREPPRGSYFDSLPPSLVQTVASLNGTTLVYEPGTHTKYSNAGISVVGLVVQRLLGDEFTRALQKAVLDRIGLANSAFAPSPEINHELAHAFMWTSFGRTFDAPTFQLGIAPAGSMYSTVGDLATFLSTLFAGGRAPSGQQLVSSETLQEMWTPQFAAPGAKSGFGLGFGVGEVQGHRRVGHDGAIYGFATTLQALPDDRLGVVVTTTLDGANSVIDRIADLALRAMLATRQRGAMPEYVETTAIEEPRARALEGRYSAGERAVALIEHWGTLKLVPSSGIVPLTLRAISSDTLIADDRLAFGPRIISSTTDHISANGVDFTRVAQPRPSAPAGSLAGLIGEYGWDFETLYVYEQGGKLFALIEWFTPYELTRVSENVYRFPASGLYDNEEVVFTRDKRGRAARATAAGIVFPRRAVGPEPGANQLKVTPLRPIADLRREALAASPPAEPGPFLPADLVELTSLDSTIKLEIRYATTNNLFGSVFYTQARAFMQRPAAEAVVRANRALRKMGYGLLIHDAYRPWFVTKVFWDATPDPKKIFVADPSKGSRHNRGAAVDLTLYDLRTGKPVDMVSTYDETSDRAFPLYPGGSSLERWHRETLRHAMEAEGFRVYEDEWWHFDYKDWQKYPIGNVPFEKLNVSARR
jgi:CubicO group peptidase (beta-lactamase class C family)/D-alanyl-D-alanine dipeptidase